jgi:WD40 repeat protein
MNPLRRPFMLLVGFALPCLGVLPAAPATPDAKLAAEAEPPRDLYGDPLPDLVLARFGTVRWRNDQKGGRPLDGVVSSPDGKLIAGLSDGGLTLWDAASGKPVDWFRPITRPAVAAFTPDGKTLVTGGTLPGRPESGPGGFIYKYRLERWEVGTGKLLGEADIKRQASSSERARVSADSKTLLSPERDKFLRLYDTTSGKMVTEIECHPEYGAGFALSPDGKTVAVLSRQLAPGEPGKLSLYEAGTGKVIRTLGDTDARYSQLAFAADGKRLATLTYRSICVFDADTGQLVREIDGVRGSLEFSPDGRYLACVERATVHLFDAKTFKEVRAFDKPSWPFVSVSVGWPDAKTLALATGHVVSLYDAETGKPLQDFAAHNGLVAALAFSSDGKRLASGDLPGGEALVWDVETTKLLHRFAGHQQAAAVVALSPDGNTLATGDGTFQNGGGERHIRLFDLEKGELKHKMPAHVNNVSSLSFAPDGRTLASAGGDGRWRLWDAATGRRLAQVRDGEGPQFFVAFAPDGKSLLLGRPNDLSVWEPDLSEKLYDVGPAGQEIRLIGYAAFLADSKTVVSCERVKDRKPGDPLIAELLRWDGGVESPQRSERLGTFQQVPYQFVLSSDGKLLAALAGTSPASRIEIWDTETGKVVADLEGQSVVSALAFSPDATMLATGGRDTTILLWDVATARLERQWRELAAGGKGIDAAALAKDPNQAVSFLRNRLIRMVALEKKASRAITDLDSDQFEVRRSASSTLEKMGPDAEFGLRLALEYSPSQEVSRAARALLDGLPPTQPAAAPWDAARLQATLKCLEALGTPGAKKALQETAEGPADLIVAKKAKEALERFGKPR